MVAMKSPHKRGDVPSGTPSTITCSQISPQAWGCTVVNRLEHICGENLPTSVGMYRCACDGTAMPGKSPHKRGDVPKLACLFARQRGISPQAWGCTVVDLGRRVYNVNLPTSVGMYRHRRPFLIARLQSPHKRGDVPNKTPVAASFR